MGDFGSMSWNLGNLINSESCGMMQWGATHWPTPTPWLAGSFQRQRRAQCCHLLFAGCNCPWSHFPLSWALSCFQDPGSLRAGRGCRYVPDSLTPSQLQEHPLSVSHIWRVSAASCESWDVLSLLLSLDWALREVNPFQSFLLLCPPETETQSLCLQLSISPWEVWAIVTDLWISTIRSPTVDPWKMASQHPGGHHLWVRLGRTLDSKQDPLRS